VDIGYDRFLVQFPIIRWDKLVLLSSLHKTDVQTRETSCVSVSVQGCETFVSGWLVPDVSSRTFRPLEVRPSRCPNMSVTNHSATRFHNPEERRPQLQRYVSLKINFFSFTSRTVTMTDTSFMWQSTKASIPKYSSWCNTAGSDCDKIRRKIIQLQ